MPRINYRHSEETKRKIGLANTGKIRTIETKNKLSESAKHRPPISETTRMKMREVAKKRKLWEWNKGKKLSEEHKKKVSEALKGRIPKNINQIKNWRKGKKGFLGYWKGKKRKDISGENHPLWKGGITEKNQTIRHSLEYKLWREAVFRRDNWTCIWCGQRGGNLNADHIKPFALYPELRFSIDNGRTLCFTCHKTTGTFGRPKKVIK